MMISFKKLFMLGIFLTHNLLSNASPKQQAQKFVFQAQEKKQLLNTTKSPETDRAEALETADEIHTLVIQSRKLVRTNIGNADIDKIKKSADEIKKIDDEAQTHVAPYRAKSLKDSAQDLIGEINGYIAADGTITDRAEAVECAKDLHKYTMQAKALTEKSSDHLKSADIKKLTDEMHQDEIKIKKLIAPSYAESLRDSARDLIDEISNYASDGTISTSNQTEAFNVAKDLHEYAMQAKELLQLKTHKNFNQIKANIDDVLKADKDAQDKVLPELTKYLTDNNLKEVSDALTTAQEKAMTAKDNDADLFALENCLFAVSGKIDELEPIEEQAPQSESEKNKLVAARYVEELIAEMVVEQAE